MNKILLITGLSIIAILGIIIADASLNAPNTWSRGTKTYLNYTDMQNETGLRNGSISNITWIGFNQESVNSTLIVPNISTENQAKIYYNQSDNVLYLSKNASGYLAVLNNLSILNTSTITKEDYGNGSIALKTVSGAGIPIYKNNTVAQNTVYSANGSSLVIVNYYTDTPTYGGCISWGATNPPSQNNNTCGGAAATYPGNYGQVIAFMNATDYYKIWSHGSATLSNIRVIKGEW